MGLVSRANVAVDRVWPLLVSTERGLRTKAHYQKKGPKMCGKMHHRALRMWCQTVVILSLFVRNGIRGPEAGFMVLELPDIHSQNSTKVLQKIYDFLYTCFEFSLHTILLYLTVLHYNFFQR